MATNLINYEKNYLWGTGYYKRKNDGMNRTLMRTTRRNFPNLSQVASKARSSAQTLKIQLKKQKKKATLMTSTIANWQM